MATTINIALDDVEEATLIKVAEEVNRDRGTSFTPLQVFRNFMREWIRQQTLRLEERDTVSLRDAYKAATAEEKAQIEAILSKYRA